MSFINIWSIEVLDEKVCIISLILHVKNELISHTVSLTHTAVMEIIKERRSGAWTCDDGLLKLTWSVEELNLNVR